MTTIGKESKIEKYMFWFMIVPALILLFVALSQPVWNANNLISQQENDCKARHGIEIVDHGLFGNTYSCESNLGLRSNN